MIPARGPPATREQQEAANMGRPDHMHDWPLHIGCFREGGRRLKKKNQRLEGSLEKGKGRWTRAEKWPLRSQHRRDEVAGKMEGQMIRNMSA